MMVASDEGPDPLIDRAEIHIRYSVEGWRSVMIVLHTIEVLNAASSSLLSDVF